MLDADLPACKNNLVEGQALCNAPLVSKLNVSSLEIIISSHSDILDLSNLSKEFKKHISCHLWIQI